MTRRYLVAYNGMDTGLGNRIRVILSARILAEREARRLYFVWPTGQRFGPRFDQLYLDNVGREMSRSVSRLLARRYPYVDETLNWLTKQKRDERVWQVRTGAPLTLPPDAPTWGERLRELTPVPEIASRVRQLYDQRLRDQPYVGVMIRSHAVSHGATKRASPVSWFLDRMISVRRQHPSVRFYVSCDTPEVQAEITERLGNCVAQTEKGGYNTVAGVRSAVVDLYLLACSHHLIAPHFSSFIHMAQHLNGDVVPIETSQTSTPDGIELDALGIVPDPTRPWCRLPAGPAS